METARGNKCLGKARFGVRRTAMLTPLFLAALVAVESPAPASAAIAVENAWVRLPAVRGRPAAGYFTLVGGAQPQRIVKVESASARRVEFHQTRMVGGVMKMAPLGDVVVPPATRVAFKPSANHAMVFGFDAGAKVGDHVSLVFTLDSGARVTAKAQVVGPGEGPTAGHEHH
jgi:hypothetical protein